MLCTVVGVTEPTPPQHWEIQEGLRQYTARNRGEGAAPGAPRKLSRHLGVAPGSGPENSEEHWDRQRVAVAGSQALCVGPGTMDRLHHTPSSGHVWTGPTHRHRHTKGRTLSGGSLSPTPAKGAQEGAREAVAVLPAGTASQAEGQGRGSIADRGGRTRV